MSTFSKIFVTLSMLCYLATSSVAAVHAFPMMGNTDSQQTVSVERSVPVGAESKNEQVAAAVMPCHQITSSAADNTKASSACKTFCSATGHAMLSIDSVEVTSTHYNRSPYSGIDSLLTRHTSVDHQPPK